MTRDCWNRVSLCDPREPLPPLLQECLRALESESGPTAALMAKLLPGDAGDQAAQSWRDAIWLAESVRNFASVEDTYVDFLSAHGPPGKPIDDLARIFGRSLRLIYINDMMGVCGWVISRPDGSVECRNYSLCKAPDWLMSEMGLPDTEWSDKWLMHIPAEHTSFPCRSDSEEIDAPASERDTTDQTGFGEPSPPDDSFF